MRVLPALPLLAVIVLLASCAGGFGGPGGGELENDAGSTGGGPPDAAAAGTDGGGDLDGGDAGAGDAGDAGAGAGDAGNDGGTGCSVSGAPGQCITVSACAAIADHSSFPGHCAGALDIECCIDTPDTADNPPVPSGYKLMRQSQVTAEMTSWAVAILHDPVAYPMFSTTTRLFGALLVLARVEWHPPDFQNHVVHRGVTLYTPG